MTVGMGVFASRGRDACSLPLLRCFTAHPDHQWRVLRSRVVILHSHSHLQFTHTHLSFPQFTHTQLSFPKDDPHIYASPDTMCVHACTRYAFALGMYVCGMWYVCMYVCMCVRVCVCMYVYMYLCMYDV